MSDSLSDSSEEMLQKGKGKGLRYIYVYIYIDMILVKERMQPSIYLSKRILLITSNSVNDVSAFLIWEDTRIQVLKKFSPEIFLII